MSDIVLRWVSRAYVGHTGWPARDLTQEELDARGLDKDVMLAYRPKLYEEVLPETEEKIAEAKHNNRGRKGGGKKKRESVSGGADPQVQPGESPDDHQSDDDERGGVDPSLHPSELSPGEDRPLA